MVFDLNYYSTSIRLLCECLGYDIGQGCRKRTSLNLSYQQHNAYKYRIKSLVTAAAGSKIQNQKRVESWKHCWMYDYFIPWTKALTVYLASWLSPAETIQRLSAGLSMELSATSWASAADSGLLPVLICLISCKGGNSLPLLVLCRLEKVKDDDSANASSDHYTL